MKNVRDFYPNMPFAYRKYHGFPGEGGVRHDEMVHTTNIPLAPVVPNGGGLNDNFLV